MREAVAPVVATATTAAASPIAAHAGRAPTRSMRRTQTNGMAAATTSTSTAMVVSTLFTRMWVRSVSSAGRNVLWRRSANSFSNGTNSRKRRAIPNTAVPRVAIAKRSATAKVSPVRWRRTPPVHTGSVRRVRCECESSAKCNVWTRMPTPDVISPHQSAFVTSRGETA